VQNKITKSTNQNKCWIFLVKIYVQTSITDDDNPDLMTIRCLLIWLAVLGCITKTALSPSRSEFRLVFVTPLESLDEHQVSPPSKPPTPVVPVPAWPTNVRLSVDHVIIASVTSPGTFHVHFHADRAAYEAMLQKLADHAPYSQRLA
jgi:hypothetical protein